MRQNTSTPAKGVRCLFLLTLTAAPACLSGTDVSPTGSSSHYIEAGSAEEAAVLRLVNDPRVSVEELDQSVRLDRRAAENIVAHRQGPDRRERTDDDDLFDDIFELDDIAYVGPKALEALLAYARELGFLSEGSLSETQRAEAILLVVNAADLTFGRLDDDIGLDRRAAESIWTFRCGGDGAFGTEDDARFEDLATLDALPFVGDKALSLILAWAIDQGIVFGQAQQSEHAVFSPQFYPASHNAKVIEVIDQARVSLDVAMYSFSDSAVYDAIERAAQRGLAIRFLFETANADRKLDDAGMASSRSARLEKMGINVRYVNKIMHHKFVMVDGPRYDLNAARTAKLVTGSANWSYSAATKYDENTLFLTASEELNLRFQREFEYLWQHSRDFAYDVTLPFEISSVDYSSIVDDPDVDVYFTSDNFSVNGDTFRINGNSTVADVLVAAIENATESIWLASGHLRSRPIASALMNHVANNPHLDVRVYLDGQEYISLSRHNEQTQALQDCVAESNTDSQLRGCYDRGYYFGYEVSQTGIPVRYKHYSYRWHYTYAVQMHHKYMIIDGDELFTGSYNLSDNAEHNTFENMIVFRGESHRDLINAYIENFNGIWETSRHDGSYESLINEVKSAEIIPLVYTPMALTWDQVRNLKALIYNNCPLIDSIEFRQDPQDHRVCVRR